MNIKLAKQIVAGLTSAYFLWCAYDPWQWHLIDGVNVVIHESEPPTELQSVVTEKAIFLYVAFS